MIKKIKHEQTRFYEGRRGEGWKNRKNGGSLMKDERYEDSNLHLLPWQ